MKKQEVTMSKKSPILAKVKGKLPKRMTYPEKKVEIKEEAYYLREVRYIDIKQLIKIEKKVYNGEVPWGRTAFLSEMNGSIPVLYLVVEHEKECVAFLSARFENSDGHISNLIVDPEFQGKGLGLLLLTELKKMAIKQGYASLSLEVRVSNLDAKRIYRKFGFESKAIKKEYYYKDKEDALEMLYLFEDKKNDKKKKSI